MGERGSCPPPPGGFPDGYRAITVTMVAGGRVRGDGSNYADRVESRCEELELDSLLAMGTFEHLPHPR